MNKHTPSIPSPPRFTPRAQGTKCVPGSWVPLPSAHLILSETRRVPQVRFSTWVLGFSCLSTSGAPGTKCVPGSSVRLPSAITNCHPDRSGPTFSSAPHFGASGRAARFVRPVRFAGMKGSRHSHRVLPPSSLFEFRSSSFAPPSPFPDRSSLISFLLSPIALQYIVLRHIPRTQPASVTIPTGGSNTGYLTVQEDSHDSAAPPALSRFAHSSMFRRTFYYRLQEAHCSAASADSA